MKGVVMDIQRYTLNESFKALVGGIFSNKEQTETLIKAFEELVNDRATTMQINFEALKWDTIEAARKELVTKEGLHAEMAETKNQLVTKADLREALAPYATKADIEKVRQDIAEVKTDLLKWFVGSQIALGGLIIAALKLL